MGYSVCHKQETKRCFNETCFYLKNFFGACMVAVAVIVLLCARENKPLNQMLFFERFPH